MVPAAVLLDAMGTLVALERPWPHLVDSLARRGVVIEESLARSAMLGEIAYYMQHHDEASDGPALTKLRGECAKVLADGLGSDVVATLSDDEMYDVMLEALVFRPFDEAQSVLAALREQGTRLVIVSNWDVSLLEVLEETGLAELVDGVVISAIEGVAKPDPRIFTRALRVAGVQAHEAVHVGDDLAVDVAGALGAGIRAVFVDRDGDGTGAAPGVTVLPDLRGLLTLS